MKGIENVNASVKLSEERAAETLQEQTKHIALKPSFFKRSISAIALTLLALSVLFLSVMSFSSGLAVAAPYGVSSVTNLRNETWTAPSTKLVNTTGGSISVIVLNATSQNLRWKAYVGNVSGSYVLADSSGSRIFDWTMTNPTGEVYATRYSGTLNWSNIQCAQKSHVEAENIALGHNSVDDNITATFNRTEHSLFYVADRIFENNECNHTAFTYVNNQTQTSRFDEILLYDGSHLVYTTLIESNSIGFDGTRYDFQMLVPERGSDGWGGATPYYFYVEIT